MIACVWHRVLSLTIENDRPVSKLPPVDDSIHVQPSLPQRRRTLILSRALTRGRQLLNGTLNIPRPVRASLALDG